jgi:Cu(I)/Ag(I) efflux system protein CusF
VKAVIAIAALAAGLAGSVWAQNMAEGEVRKIDKGAKKITLKHGPIPSIDMPAMTMVFPVKDPALLDKAKPGQKVKFQAEMISGTATVTQIEPMK